MTKAAWPEIGSSEFRKTYAKLTEVTVVEVLGRPIGIWTPVSQWEHEIGVLPMDNGVLAPPTTRVPIMVIGRETPQAKRDAILRKINRGG